MINKKITALVLSGAILVGGLGLGTYSWFTSSAKATANLKIHTGTLKVEASNDDKWAVQNTSISDGDLKSEVTNPKATNDFENVRPGDSFVKFVTFTNKGTLKQRVHFEISKDLGQYYSKLHISVPKEQDTVLEPGHSKSVKIKIDVPTDLTNSEQEQFIKTFEEVENKTLLDVTATQVNQK